MSLETPASKTKNLNCIKVYAKDSADLPEGIDFSNRYSYIPAHGEQYLERIYNFEVRKDDVWVITLPKCGTTWMLELVWLLVNNMDYVTALTIEQEYRCPFIEYNTIFHLSEFRALDAAENLNSPRVIKSHLPIHMLPRGLWVVKPKIIYVVREPKDAAISYYHFRSGLGVVRTSRDNFLNEFMKDTMAFHPFWLHAIEFWNLRKESNIYFTSFERMKRDLPSVVTQVAEFLRKPIKENEMGKLLDHLSFEKMKNNPMVNHVIEYKEAQRILGGTGNNESFIRKGAVGSHKEEFTADMIQRFDEWTEKDMKQFGVSSWEILYS